jgi:diaminohydroxyphosphoribosylaminopyrimidine deaminase/5-amino-6-(5-phosphoribosylamino)uracil reductase
MPGTPRQEQLMRTALRLAARGRGQTSPNPLGGAVVIDRRGSVVGRGYHARAGEAHAEIKALAAAGRRARGATLYVNLEPCSHQGKTGPCTRAILDAGISRVVIGMKDPNPLVNGKGIAALRRAGVNVAAGVLEGECRRLNESFCCYMARRRPHVTFKSAVTLDGHVAARTGDSRWVTGPAALKEGHKLRHTCDAIVVGVGTVLIDDPTLTCRGIRGGRDPIRVVVDSRLRTPTTAKVVAAAAGSSAPTWIVTTARAPRRQAAALEAAGARVMRLKSRARRVPIPAFLERLGDEQVTSILLEGGPTLAGSFWTAGLVDRMVAFVAPKVLGDPAGLPMLAGGAVPAMAAATDLDEVAWRRVGADLMLTGTPRFSRADRRR